jgi:prepilin-type N-terminal cleavage/methylation domain-containing protein
MRTNKGFTLIELMIVMAIIGILASIFYPMWRDRNLTDYQRQQKREALQREYANTGVRCIGGYKFAQPDWNNPPVQIKDNTGNGIPCQ